MNKVIGPHVHHQSARFAAGKSGRDRTRGIQAPGRPADRTDAAKLHHHLQPDRCIEEAPPAPVTAEPAEAPAPVDDGAATLLADFAAKLIEQPGELAEYGRRFQRAAKAADWEGYARNLSQFVEKAFPQDEHD